MLLSGKLRPKFGLDPIQSILQTTKSHVTQKLKFVLGRVEDIVGKGENAGKQHFLLFPQCFLKLSFQELLSSKVLTLYQTTEFWKLTKFKAFAEKIIVTQKLKFVLRRVENIVGKEENASKQHFIFFPQCFLRLSFPEVLKVGIMW